MLAAIAVPLCVLPSAAWRALHASDVLASGPGQCGVQSEGEAIYVLGLSAVSMAAALLTFGLVRPWGEVLPGWLPLAGGRRIPPLVVTVLAGSFALGLACLTGLFFANQAFGFRDSQALADGCSKPGLDVLVYYAPLLAWSPLLAVLAVHYYRRRRREGDPNRLNQG